MGDVPHNRTQTSVSAAEFMEASGKAASDMVRVLGLLISNVKIGKEFIILPEVEARTGGPTSSTKKNLAGSRMWNLRNLHYVCQHDLDDKPIYVVPKGLAVKKTKVGKHSYQNYYLTPYALEHIDELIEWAKQGKKLPISGVISEENVEMSTSKKCGSCGSTNLMAMVTIQKMVPLADRNWTLKIGGQKIGQVDLKAAWDNIGGQVENAEQPIRGPIMCGECETQHYVVMGDKNPLRVGDVAEARNLGIEELRTK